MLQSQKINQNYAKFISSFFMNLFENIERPKRMLGSTASEQRIKKWFKDVLEWTYSEELWFELYEEFLGYNGDYLRKVIRKKIKRAVKKRPLDKNNKELVK